MDFERQGQLLAKRPVMDMPAPGGRTDMPRWWARVSFWPGAESVNGHCDRMSRAKKCQSWLGSKRKNPAEC